MADILKKLEAHHAARQAEHAAGWAQFVAAVADGRTCDPDLILAELEQLGRTPADLQNAVDLLSQRRRWADELASGIKAEQQYPDLLKQQADAEDELKKLIEKHHRKYGPLESEILSTRRMLEVADSARARLRETVPAVTKERLTGDLHEQRRKLETAIISTSQRRREHGSFIHNHHVTGDKDPKHQTLATQKAERSEDLTKTLEHLRSELAEVQDRLKAAESQYLQADCI